MTARADALFELTDAVPCGDQPVTSLVQLSLSPVFRRGHGALYDGLVAGGIDTTGLKDVLATGLPACDNGGPLVFAGDVSACPRPDAECSSDRGHCCSTCRCDRDRKTIAGWNYSWLVGGLHHGFHRWMPAG